MRLVAAEAYAETAPTVAPDVELSPSVIKILSGAIDVIASRGARRLSMSDIIDTSGVSRGTLYRYFSNKDEVLAAVSEFVCAGFENGIREAGQGITDPIERFKAVMQFYARYTNENSPDRVFEVEPGFHLAFAAPSRAAVDEFHKAALLNGGKDNGAAGLRPDYGDEYYAAFVIDPDGYPIEAVINGAEQA